MKKCKCGNLARPDQRNCKACHAASMRKHRRNTPLTPEQRAKDNCRSYAGSYLKRGKITRSACRTCGEEKAEMHHPDYTKPLDIVWLCRPCHMQLHEGESRAKK